MAKARSPSYPAIGLKEAIEKVQLVYDKDYQNELPKKVVAEHMGYKGLSGASLPILAALRKYGLLEGRGDDTRVSDLALAIIAHDHGTDERIAAIKTAASNPTLFSDLDHKFQGGKASDTAIRSYLLTQKFIPEAADAAIRAYRETKQLVEAEWRGYPSAEIEPEEPLMDQQPRESRREQLRQPLPFQPREQKIVTEDRAPYQFWHAPGRLRGEFDITDEASADEYLRAVTAWINAWKLLQRSAFEAKKPKWADKTFGPGDTVPGSTPFHVHHVGHDGERLIEPNEGDTFPPCDKCGDKVRYTLA